MWVIRALIALIFAAAVILIDLPLHLITWLIEKASPGSCTKFRHGYARFAMKGIWLLAGGRATVLGLENIPEDHPVLFVGNHRSIFDIILAGSLIKYPVGFVAKKELQGTPITLIMEEIHCLFLDREDPRQGLKTILTAIDYVKSGISMFIFPEGTRCKVEGTFLPFHAGSFKIATKAKVPIVPVTIVGMGDVFEDHYPRLKWAPVVIEFGKPIETADMDRNAQKDLPDKVKALMEETYKKNSELIAKK
ncbi:MAG: lysophospholipid acyltransferase family protein [Lachnospiraceae bacterium]|jgi:1-acyl-sn-glycerol-3-phosphate acyltransferase